MLSPPTPADLNGDGSVAFDDLLTLAQHYNRPGTAAEGDIDGSGTIDFADLEILAQIYGYRLTWSTPVMEAAGGAQPQSTEQWLLKRRTRVDRISTAIR